jgi:hypothetical protein
MSDALLERVREICLALPETSEARSFQSTFRVREKNFAWFMDDHHGDGRVAIWCKAPVGAQGMLVQSNPERFFVPPYVGPKGWIGIRLDVGKVDWDEVAELVEESYRMTAPRRLVAELDRERAGPKIASD